MSKIVHMDDKLNMLSDLATEIRDNSVEALVVVTFDGQGETIRLIGDIDTIRAIGALEYAKLIIAGDSNGI